MSAGGVAKSGYAFVMEDQAEFARFLQLRHRPQRPPVNVSYAWAILTENLSDLL